MKITKTQQIIAGVFGVVLIIGGGVTIKKQHDEAEAKKAAELAYANRPIVEAECIMNGYGQGSCSFTNTGKTTGAKCGHIQVNGPGIVTSAPFCSGQVAPMSTTKVEFNIPAVDELCDNGFQSWTEKCGFSFYERGLGGGETQGV
jgi:hypothetical protein